MIYSIEFDDRAFKEWNKLSEAIKAQFKKKLIAISKSPKIQQAKLRELKDCYKIKLRQSGYRMVYQVIDEEIIILVLSVGKRDKSIVYENAKKRTDNK